MGEPLDIRRELRKLLFAACCATGALAGLWQAILTAPPGLDFSGLAEAVAPRFGAGLGAGMAVGALICGVTVALRRAVSRLRRQLTATGAAASDKRRSSSATFSVSR